MRRKKTGLTMVELLVVVAVLAILIILALLSWRTQVSKARDARRKDDINKIKIAFEGYYNDHECYPPATVLSTCRSSDLQPYLAFVPCDPETGLPYLYQPKSDCTGYQASAAMENEQCFGVAVGEALTLCAARPTPAPTATAIPGGPTPTPTGSGQPGPSATPWGQFACDSRGECNLYDRPWEKGCPVAFTNANDCWAACRASSSNWCKGSQ